MILIEETTKRFGYNPVTLLAKSQKLIVRQCDICGTVKDVKREHAEVLCRSCTSSKAATKLNEEAKRAGKSARGLPLEGRNKEKIRKRNREWRRLQRQTLKGKLINRLKVALRNCFNGRRTWSVLSYSKDELTAHIEHELRRYAYRCPLCGVDITQRFDIDHRISLSSVGDDEQEIIALFALSNLSVLCPSCNQHRKGKNYVDY